MKYFFFTCVCLNWVYALISYPVKFIVLPKVPDPDQDPVFKEPSPQFATSLDSMRLKYMDYEIDNRSSIRALKLFISSFYSLC